MLQRLLRHLVVAVGALAATLIVAPAVHAADPAQSVVASGVAAGGSVSRAVKVGLNKSLVIDLPRDARDILVSNPVIADAVIRTPRRIYVTGVAVGLSNVIVFDRAGQQIVALDLQVERDTSALADMLRRLIPDSNIKVEIVSDNIVLSGTVKNESDSRRAQDIANVFANGGAEAQPGATSTAGSSSSSSSGSVNITLAANVPTSSVVNMLTIEGEDQVHLRVTVAEVNRNVIKQLGIDWNADNITMGGLTLGGAGALPFAVSGTGFPALTLGGKIAQQILSQPDGSNPGDPPTYTTQTATLGSTIRALEQSSMFHTLAEPTLTAISGETASFLAGGEFPVPTGRDSSGNVAIQFKPFGVALSFTPVVLSEGRISLRVKTEVSELSSEGALQLGGIAIPSLKVRRAESTLELPSGGSMVLGGLIQDSLRESVSQVPGLGKLPILGQLFRSRDFQRKETELVIFITPYLVKPVPRSALAMPDQGYAPASDAQSILFGSLNKVYGGAGKQPDAGYKGPVGFIYE